MILSVRVKDEDGDLIKAYAGIRGETVSGLLRATMMKTLEQEYRQLMQGEDLFHEQTVYYDMTDEM